MRPGRILVADHEGIYVIKMVGDVRLTLCISFDQFIDRMFSRDDFSEVLFDLSEAEAIDSTTLGLMAKIALEGRDRKGTVPIVYTTNDSIIRLLHSMGFHEIFTITHQLDTPVEPDQALPHDAQEEQAVRAKVIEAHQVLMGLNRDNKETFRNLVKTLEEN